MRFVLLALVGGTIAGIAHQRPASPPAIEYTLRVDPTRDNVADVSIRLADVPDTVRLAMKVHPEYDAAYWRYLDGIRVDGTTDDTRAKVERVDSTLWQVVLPGGRGVVHYRVHVQAQQGPTRRAWQPFFRETGALINGPDFFLYLPDFSGRATRLTIDAPASWRIATSLSADVAGRRFTAPDAAALLDSPLLLGGIREWPFSYKNTTYHIAYWPLPDAAPFDTLAFADAIQRLSHAAADIFGGTPTRDYWFLFQDGAGDALEHRASVTVGLTSAALAADVHASLPEIAHEFFHTWNLVAIHPDHYGDLMFDRAEPTTGLWMGEGVTIYYADALLRRAGLPADGPTRIEHLQRLLENYYAAWWSSRVSPEAASLAFGHSPLTDRNATGGYYVQGEVLGYAIDAAIRDSTNDARGLDDLMRALYARSNGGTQGFTSRGLAAAADSVCGCRLESLFARQVRGAAPIDLQPAMRRIGFQLDVDTVQATDSTGHAIPDRRLGIDFVQLQPLRIVIGDSSATWARAGLRTGDEMRAWNGAAVTTWAALRSALNAIRVGDTVAVDVLRDGRPVRSVVHVTGFSRARVRIVERPYASAAERARRTRWERGW